MKIKFFGFIFILFAVIFIFTAKNDIQNAEAFATKLVPIVAPITTFSDGSFTKDLQFNAGNIFSDSSAKVFFPNNTVVTSARLDEDSTIVSGVDTLSLDVGNTGGLPEWTTNATGPLIINVPTVATALNLILDTCGCPGCLSSPAGCTIDLRFYTTNATPVTATLSNLEIYLSRRELITTGGLIPCGRADNNPNTPWDDSAPCEFCHGIMLLNQGMNFLMKIASVVTVLALIVVGFLFIFSAGNPELKNTAKTSFKWIIFGFLVIFLSWLIVDFLLSAWGYLDPLGGEWSVVCD